MSRKSTESTINNNCNNCNYKNECDIFHYGDITDLKFANEIIDNQRKKIRELEKENEIHLREGMWLLRFLKTKGFTEDDVIKFKKHIQKQNR